MGAVGKVQAGNVHAVAEHLLHDLRRRRCRAKGTYDFGFTHGEHSFHIYVDVTDVFVKIPKIIIPQRGQIARDL
jgi:hypothetical protein